jgi:hypothetical protein
MKKFSLIAALAIYSLGFSQEETKTESNWKKSGVFTAIANQSTFNNWIAGGVNNLAVNANINYDFNYKKDDISWDNKLILAYGVTKIEEADLVKSDDRIDFNSLFGKKAKWGENWYYSGFLSLKTQMTTDLGSPAPKAPFPTRSTRFFAPAFLELGPGLMWKKSDNLNINIAPATARFVFVMDQQLADLGAFGVKNGDNLRFEFGASLRAYYKFNLMENVTIENILNLYTNYLDKPQNVDINYLLNVNMPINKWLSANASFQAIYDDNALQAWQTRQLFGLGFNTTF